MRQGAVKRPWAGVAAWRLMAVGVITAAAVLAAGSGVAGASTKSRVSIRAIPGSLLGYVSSSRASCADDRKVAIFKANGDSASGRYRRVGIARARRVTGGLYQWLAKTSGRGHYYAKARRKPGCNTSHSRTVTSVTGGSGDVPVCPGDGPVCKFPYKVYLDIRYGDSIVLPCPNFNKANGHCHGVDTDPPSDWGSGWPPDTAFDWHEYDGSKRSVSWNVYPDGGYLTGTLPGPGSAAWTIREAGMNDDGHPDKGTKWFTPDQAGKEPGTLGGPFYIDFRNAPFGADIFIWGYLFKKP